MKDRAMLWPGHIPVSDKLRMLAAAAVAALALSACGGGGGTGTLGPSLTAGGVTAGVEYDTTNSEPSLSIKKGETAWTHSPPTADVQAVPNHEHDPSDDWATLTRINATTGSEKERFRVVANIESASDVNYLAYGYWNRVPLDSLDDYKPFYYGANPYDGNVQELTESRTVIYYGGATGVYREHDATEVAGRFTANVRIRVDFNPDSNPAFNFRLKDIRSRTSDGSGAGQSKNTFVSVFNGNIEGPSGHVFTDEDDPEFRLTVQFLGYSGFVPIGVVGTFSYLTGDIGGEEVVALFGVYGARD